MNKAVYLSMLVSIVFLAFAFKPKSTLPSAAMHVFQEKNEPKAMLEETFLSLDSVWIPGKRQKFSLHPFDNYLWVKDGAATFICDKVRGKSFHGPINGVKVENINGAQVTTFTVRNAKMRVEITDLGNERFEIFTYNYLDQYERMFSAYWVDVSKVTFVEEE